MEKKEKPKQQKEPNTMSLFFNKNNPMNATLCANMEKWSVGDHNTLYLIQYDYSCDEI